MKEKALTQDELVKFLKRCGFTDITSRRITDWRENHLLPKFDKKGRGLGKGKGKISSQWSNRKEIINQAIWVIKLLETYRSFKDLYLPLWILGYPIPLNIVRKHLIEPLEYFLEDIQEEAFEKVIDAELLNKETGFIEDYISDIVYKICRKDDFSKMFSLPESVGEALLNIFVNPEYQLLDFHIEFEEGLSELETKKQIVENKLLAAFELEKENTEIQSLSSSELLLNFISNNAQFVQNNFSASRLLQSVKNISDMELNQVQLDMGIIYELTQGINEALKTLMKDTPIVLEGDQLKGLVQMLFSFSNLIIWMDVSLRHNGYSELINQTRFELLQKFKDALNSEETKKGLEEASSIYAKSFDKILISLETGLNNLFAKNTLLIQETH